MKETTNQPVDRTEKNKALETAVGAIEKQFGKGAIMRLGKNAPPAEPMQVTSTGAFSLDMALGIGGLPAGRVVEIYGPESSGKTTIALHAVAEAQKRGGVAAFIDAEHALDTIYAKSIGVNLDELLLAQPDTGEQALEIVDMLVRSDAVDLIIIDSVAARTPRAEIEGEMGDQHMGLQARLMSQALRKLTGHISRSKTLVFFINQIRMKIGVMFGSPETTTGGNALKFYASVRLDIRKIASLKQGEEIIGNRVRVKVVKNKMSAPFKLAEFDIIFGKGISREGDVLDLAVLKNIVQKSGSWFSYNEERLGQGREGVKDFLVAHPELLNKIEQELKASYGLAAAALAAEKKGVEVETESSDAKTLADKKIGATKAPVVPPKTAAAATAVKSTERRNNGATATRN